MGRHGILPVTQFSAAQALAQWTLEHGRAPMTLDCRPTEGLMWPSTYYKCFEVSCFSAALSLAFSLVPPISGGLPVSADGSRSLKPCLNAPACSAFIVDEGRHIRFCARCRGKQREHAAVDDSYFLPALSTRTLARLQGQRYGSRHEFMDLSEE
jgi:hypothetical protein